MTQRVRESLLIRISGPLSSSRAHYEIFSKRTSPSIFHQLAYYRNTHRDTRINVDSCLGEWAEGFHFLLFCCPKGSRRVSSPVRPLLFYDTSPIIFVVCTVCVWTCVHAFKGCACVWQCILVSSHYGCIILLSVIKVSHGERHTATEREHTYCITLSHTHTYFHNQECDGISFLSPQIAFEIPVTLEMISGADGSRTVMGWFLKVWGRGCLW